MRSLAVTRVVLMAVVGLLFGGAKAGFIDGTVLINRAANNKTITVKYDGVRAALVELRVNGESISSRSVDDKATLGETNFALNPAVLADGDNTIEVRLFDSGGKLVAHQSTSVYVDRKPSGPVFLERPKAGSTVLGPVEIRLGLQQNLRNVYVSFFVDDDFKSLRNYPPYTYLWDTSGVPNGWHEVQAWVVDVGNASRTFKTEKMRLYVNNPNGRTERIDPLGGSSAGSAATGASSSATVGGTSNASAGSSSVSVGGAGNASGDAAGIKPTKAGSGQSAPILTAVKPTLGAPTVSANTDRAATSGSAGTKAPDLSKGAMTGQRTLLPTGTRVAVTANATPANETIEPGSPEKLALREINFGARLNDKVGFPVELNGHILNFEVATRVIDGVPFAPFRHLFEEAGGEVRWIHATKTVEADGLGNSVRFRIGEDYGLLNGTKFLFERAPYIEAGRTVVPLSFVGSTLKVDVQYDPNTGHVLITSNNRK